jgi:Tfp pilus assembly protein PilX
MLSKTYPTGGGAHLHGRQRGLVLVIVLIVLVAMMLAGIALMRSVNTTTLVAGNMAFRQAATHQGDVGTEAAIQWLQANNSGTTLQQSITTSGYLAKTAGPSSSQTWDTYWQKVLDISPVSRPVATAVNSGSVWTLATLNGYTVSFVIHRLCNATGDPVAVGVDCAQSPLVSSTSAGNSQTAGSIALQYNSQVYYRITSRIEGPRNTVSYTQAVVAM